jgi:hypothetical protein
MSKFAGLVITLSACAFIASGGYALFAPTLPLTSSLAAGSNGSVTSRGACNIKGNISVNTGERIYHMPGQTYHATTKISPQYGERWFCSEAEAQAAGWRRSKL